MQSTLLVSHFVLNVASYIAIATVHRLTLFNILAREICGGWKH